MNRKIWGLSFILALLPGIAGLMVQGAQPEKSIAAAEVAFTHGLLAYQRGEYERAAALFAEAERQDPRQGTTLHWLGIAYYQMHRLEEAAAALERSLKAQQPPAAGTKRVQDDLEKIRELMKRGSGPGTAPAVEPPGAGVEIPDLEKPPLWEARLGLEAGEDSNPGVLPESLAGGTPLITGPQTASSDQAAHLAARLAFQPFYDRRGWSLGGILAGSHSLHRDFGQLDLSYGEGVIALAWGTDVQGYVAGPLGHVRVPSRPGRLSALVQAGGGLALLDGKPYLRQVEGAGSLQVRESRSLVTRLDAEVRKRAFNEDGTGALRLSGTEAAVGASQYFFFGRMDRYLRLGFSIGDRGGGSAFEGSFEEAFAEASAPLPGPWTLFLLGSRREDRFAHRESNLSSPSGPERSDTSWRLTAAATWRISRRLHWTARGNWAERDSNIEFPPGFSLFDYRRSVVSTGFLWTF